MSKTEKGRLPRCPPFAVGADVHCLRSDGTAVRRDRFGTRICEHGRRHDQCKPCGGSGICEHNRQRSRCKECGGSAFCKHGRRKGRCKECGGSGICQHGRRKSNCKECGGSSICEHGLEKRRCKQCGGSGICKHDRQKWRCKECRRKPTVEKPPPIKRQRLAKGVAPAVKNGTRVAVAFDDGVVYGGTVKDCCVGQIHIQYDDGEDEWAEYPDTDIVIERDGSSGSGSGSGGGGGGGGGSGSGGREGR